MTYEIIRPTTFYQLDISGDATSVTAPALAYDNSYGDTSTYSHFHAESISGGAPGYGRSGWATDAWQRTKPWLRGESVLNLYWDASPGSGTDGGALLQIYSGFSTYQNVIYCDWASGASWNHTVTQVVGDYTTGYSIPIGSSHNVIVWAGSNQATDAYIDVRIYDIAVRGLIDEQRHFLCM